jgi:hypothetical protein
VSKKQAFVINGEIFNTKVQLEERVRGIVASYPDRQLLNPMDFAFILDLLGNHPQAGAKLGCGISAFYVQRNPIYPSNRNFMLVRADGSETDFSWRECLRPTPHCKKVQRACRVLVEPYTMEFKQAFFDEQGGSAICPLTGQVMRFVGSHVDHVAPKTFEWLFNAFIAQYGLDVNQIPLRNELADNKYVDQLGDYDLAESWIDFHNQYAELRVISALANLSHAKVRNQAPSAATLTPQTVEFDFA